MNRTNIDKPYTVTIRFKQLFPTFTEWQANLQNYNIDPSYIQNDDYKKLFNLYGDICLFTNNVPNLLAAVAIY